MNVGQKVPWTKGPMLFLTGVDKRSHVSFDRGGHKVPSRFDRAEIRSYLSLTGVGKRSHLLNFKIRPYVHPCRKWHGTFCLAPLVMCTTCKMCKWYQWLLIKILQMKIKICFVTLNYPALWSDLTSTWFSAHVVICFRLRSYLPMLLFVSD